MERRSTDRLQPEEFRQQWISEAAYYRAQQRAFAAGHEREDWLAAEKAFNAMVISRHLANLAEDDDETTVIGLQKLAKTIGIPHYDKMADKKTLIHALQIAVGKDPCFQTDTAFSALCHEQTECVWRSECRKLMASWFSLTE